MAKSTADKRVLNNYLLFDFVRVTAAPGGLVWLRPKRVYESAEAKKRVRGGALVIANHTGYLDPVYLMHAIWYRRHHFVCMDSFFDGRFRNWLFTRFHCIPIDRDDFSMRSLNRITQELKLGRLVTMFPEGHLTREGDIAPFKSGMILLALKSGSPIVPVYVKRRKHWYSRLTVCIGESFDVREALGEKPTLGGIDAAAAMLEQREKRLAELLEDKV